MKAILYKKNFISKYIRVNKHTILNLFTIFLNMNMEYLLKNYIKTEWKSLSKSAISFINDRGMLSRLPADYVYAQTCKINYRAEFDRTKNYIQQLLRNLKRRPEFITITTKLKSKLENECPVCKSKQHRHVIIEFYINNDLHGHISVHDRCPSGDNISTIHYSSDKIISRISLQKILYHIIPQETGYLISKEVSKSYNSEHFNTTIKEFLNKLFNENNFFFRHLELFH
jgi:hypothetical protein